MKKLIFLLICLFSMSSALMADNEKPIQLGQLPTKAQTFLTTYFKSSKVALVKEESDLFYKSYDVIFTTGEKVEFNRAGEWQEVKCKANGVPEGIIPAEILRFVKENYPDAVILSIERDKKEYEVKLSNRWEIKFNQRMQVIDIDED